MLGGAVSTIGLASAAHADTRAYELYCPGTPVGDIVLNDVVTSGTLSPPHPGAGEHFRVTNYQTTITFPNSIASAAQALGNTHLPGTLTSQVDAVGASPSVISKGPVHFAPPLPSPVPANGLVVAMPSPPTSIGPFTASGSNITISLDKRTSVTLNVSGSTLAMTCTAHRNHSLPSGITESRPYGGAISPVIATSITPLVVNTTSLANATIGQPYAATLAATGGNPPYIWRLAAESARLPKGLKVNRKTGVISGTPNQTDAGTFHFTVEVLDKRLRTKPHTQDVATKALSITVS